MKSKLSEAKSSQAQVKSMLSEAKSNQGSRGVAGRGAGHVYAYAYGMHMLEGVAGRGAAGAQSHCVHMHCCVYCCVPGRVRAPGLLRLSTAAHAHAVD